MGEIVNLADHKLIKYHAATQGLTYKEYRNYLRLCHINLEEAIENARKGITVNECLRKREKRNKLFGLGLIVAAAAAGIIGMYAAHLAPTETRINDKETLTEFVMKYGIN